MTRECRSEDKFTTERTLRSRPCTKKPESLPASSSTPAQKARLRFAAKVGKKLGNLTGRLVRKNMKVFLGLLAIVALMFFGVIRFGVGGSTISLHLPKVTMPTSQVAAPKKETVVVAQEPQKTEGATRPCAVPQKPKKSAPVLQKAVHRELPGVAVSNNEGWRVHPTEPRSLLSPALLCTVYPRLLS